MCDYQKDLLPPECRAARGARDANYKLQYDDPRLFLQVNSTFGASSESTNSMA